jgi:hypothetical protein
MVGLAVGLVVVAGSAWLTIHTAPVAARGGWQSTSARRFETRSHALVFVSPEAYAWRFDTWTQSEVADRYRLEAESADRRRLFVGLTSVERVIPPSRAERRNPSWDPMHPCNRAAMQSYLARATYQVVDSQERSQRNGGVALARPSTQRFWASSFVGRRGTVDLSSRVPTYWLETSYPPLAPRVECGFTHVAIVMNADGSRGVAADVRFGARILAFSLVATVFSVTMLLAGILLVVRDAVARRREHKHETRTQSRRIRVLDVRDDLVVADLAESAMLGETARADVIFADATHAEVRPNGATDQRAT